MNVTEFLRESCRGGPGLDGYAFKAEVLCVECGRAILAGIAPRLAPRLTGVEDPFFRDSETLPQPIFFGESDCAEHCAQCGEYLYGKEKDDGLGKGV